MQLELSPAAQDDLDVIFFRPTAELVRIERILHSARDIQAELNPQEDGDVPLPSFNLRVNSEKNGGHWPTIKWRVFHKDKKRLALKLAAMPKSPILAAVHKTAADLYRLGVIN